MSVPDTPWDRLYGDVKVEVAGITDAVYAQYLYRTVKDFLDMTNVWQETVPITGMPNTFCYPFTLAGKGTPHRLLIVYDPAMATNPNNRRWLPNGASMQRPGEIIVGHAPSSQVNWEAIVSKNITEVDSQLQPDMDTDDQWIIDRYRDAFFYGTAARLQRSPGKVYTNAALATDNMRQYISLRSQARTEALRKNTFGAQAWTFPQSFATVRRGGWV